MADMADPNDFYFPPVAQPQNKGWLGPGLAAGYQEMRGSLDAAAAAIGRATGMQGLQQWGQEGADQRFAAAQQQGNQEYERNPWSLGGIGYQVAKAVPSLAGALVAGALVPEAAVPAWLARAGAAAPRLIGGGAGLAEDAAAAAGKRFASSLVGATAAGYPMAAGGMYNTAVQSGQDTQGNALKALALGVPAAAVGGVMPGQLRDLAASGIGGNAIKRVLMGAMETGPMGAVQSGVQTALNQQFDDPNKTLTERMHEIVQSTIQGGIVGGVFGGALGGIRRASEQPPAQSGEASQATAAPPPPPAARRSLRTPEMPQSLEGGRLDVPYYTSGPNLQDILGQTGLEPQPGAEQRVPTNAPFWESPLAEEPGVPAAPATPGQPPAVPPTEAVDRTVRLMNQLHGDNPSPGLLRIAEKTGVADLVNKPYAELTPDQQALHDAAYPLTERGQQEAIWEQAPSDAVARVVDQLRTGQPTEGFQRIANSLGLNDLVNKPYDQLSDAQKALYDRMQPLTQEGQNHAVQEPIPAAVDVRESAGPSEGIRGGNPEGDIAARQGEAAQAQEGSGAAAASQEAKQSPLTALNKQDMTRFGSWLKKREPIPDVPIEDSVKAHILDAMRDGNTPKAVQKAADAFGLTDLVDKPRDQLTPEQQTELDRLDPLTKAGQQAAATSDAARETAGFPPQEIDMSDPDQIKERLDRPGRTPITFGRRGGPAVNQPTGNPSADVASIIQNRGTSSDLLDYYSKAGTDEFAREYATRLKAAGYNPKLAFGIPDNFAAGSNEALKGAGFTTAAGYDGRSNTIYLTNRPGPLLQQDFLHEATHAATLNKIDSQTAAAGEVRRLFDRSQFSAKLFGAADNPDLKYGFTDAHEFLAEAFANPRFQEYLKTQSPDFWQSIKNGVFKMLGMPDRVRTMFDAVVDNGYKMIEDRNLTLTDGREPPPGFKPTVGSVPDSVDMMRRMVPSIDDMKGYFQKQLDDVRDNPVSLMDRIRTGALGWQDAKELTMRFDHMFGGHIGNWYQAKELGRMITDRLGSMMNPVRAAAREVARTNPQANSVWNSLRAKSQVYGFDYRKWASEQPKVTENMDPARAQAYTAMMDEAKRSWDGISGVAGKADDLQRAASKVANFMKMNLLLDGQYRRFYSDRDLPAFQRDPIMEVVQHPDMLENPAAVADYVKSTLNDRLTQLTAEGAARAPDVEALYLRADELAEKYQQADISGSAELKELMKSGVSDEVVKAFKKSHAFDMAAARDEMMKTRQQADDLKQYQADIVKLTKSMRDGIAQADDQPFFHLGRNGDQFVSMRLKLGQDGKVDQEAFAALQKRLSEAGFDRLVIDQGNENNQFFARLNSPTERDRLHSIGKELLQKGLLAAPGKDPVSGETVEHPLSAGPVDNIEASMFRGNAPSAVDKLLSQLEEQYKDLPPEIGKDLMGKLRGVYLDMLPKNSMVRLFEPRMGVQGFNEDMSASHDQYMSQFANAAGRMWTQPRVMDSLAGLAQGVNGYKQDPLATKGAVDVADRVAKEIMQRETAAPARSNWNWMRNWLSLNHMYFLGLSPTYTVELMTQIPTLLLPELGRKFGYLDSAKAIGNSFNPSIKVVKALLASGHGADGILTPDALRKAGLNEQDADFIMKVALRSKLELGGWTKATVSDAPSIAKSRMGQYATTMTVASEVLPRVMAAFAARELHTAEGGAAKARLGLNDYVDNTIEQSMYNWQTDLQARHLGTGGFAGPITPLVTKFMSFQTKMLNRLVREVDTAMGGHARNLAMDDVAKGATGSVDELTKQYQTEARRFLAGHLAAVTVLAGSLGLPVLPMAASAASSAANFLTGSDQYDAETWYRSHLNDIFGPQVGEVIAKGVPRALGFDLSEHAGEDRLIPFSDLLTDKRKWSDAFDSAAFKALGSPFSMASSMIRGGTDLANGRILKGMQEVMPSSAKNPFRAWRLSQYGYEDDNGHKLPGIGDPSALDIAMQAVGIPSAAKARDQDVTEALHDLQNRRQIATSNMEARLNTALAHGDNDAFQQVMGQYAQYNQAHPTDMANPMSAIGRTMRQQMMGQSFGSNIFNPRNQEQWNILRAHGMLPTQQ